MRVLMLCNDLMEQLKQKQGMPNGKPESWINGVYNMMQDTPELEVMYLFPSKQQEFAFSEGRVEFRSYPQTRVNRLEREQLEAFTELVKSFMPDVIHVFGTEYAHTYAMVKACEALGYADRVLIHIQGLVKFYSHHYCANLPIRILRRKTFRDVLRGGGYGMSRGSSRYEAN